MQPRSVCKHLRKNRHQHALNFTKMHFMSPTLQIGHQHHILKYNYVGDRLTCYQHAEKCHQRPYFVINILKLLPT